MLVYKTSIGEEKEGTGCAPGLRSEHPHLPAAPWRGVGTRWPPPAGFVPLPGRSPQLHRSLRCSEVAERNGPVCPASSCPASSAPAPSLAPSPRHWVSCFGVEQRTDFEPKQSSGFSNKTRKATNRIKMRSET